MGIIKKVVKTVKESITEDENIVHTPQSDQKIFVLTQAGIIIKKFDLDERDEAYKFAGDNGYQVLG